MLVSVAQQSESAICIHMSPYPLPLETPSHTPYPTPLGHRESPSRSPCAMLLLPTSQLFYIRYCIYVYATLTLPPFRPPTPCHQVHSLCLPLYSCPATRFISTIFFFRFHIYALAYGICFSLSDLLHSVWQNLGPSTSLQITQFHFFSWLSNIPLYICATSSYPFICQWTFRLVPCPGYCK